MFCNLYLFVNIVFAYYNKIVHIRYNYHLGCSFPSLIILGTYAANHGPNEIAKACAIPSLGVFLAHKGAK